MWHDKQLTENGKMFLIFKKANNFHSGKHLENDACFVKLILLSTCHCSLYEKMHSNTFGDV